MIVVEFTKYIEALSEYHHYHRFFSSMENAEAFIRHISMDNTIFGAKIQ